jgi:hypothetical protein
MNLHPAYREFNQKLLQFIFDRCEADGGTIQVDRSFYEAFIGMTEKERSAVIGCVIRERNAVQLFGQEQGPIDSVKLILKMVGLGIMGFMDKGRLGFNKPVGEPPDEAMLSRIKEAIDSWTPLIRQKLNEAVSSASKRN